LSGLCYRAGFAIVKDIILYLRCGREMLRISAQAKACATGAGVLSNFCLKRHFVLQALACHCLQAKACGTYRDSSIK
jgi:hypothetical protein